MTPVAELVGKWIATVNDDIVGVGASMKEAIEDAIANGYEEDQLLLDKVAEPGGYIL